MDSRALAALVIIFSLLASGCLARDQAPGGTARMALAQNTTPPDTLEDAPANDSAPYEPADTPDAFIRDYAWTYREIRWNARLVLPKACYLLYKNRPHDRLENYAGYALSDYDRSYLKGLIGDFREAGASRNYTDTENVLNVLAFVQSLPYATDKASTGYDEYPRYPIETLVDGGGDCEDTAILATALLNEMGYGTVLIRLPGHMALGVKCSGDRPGTYYEYKGSRYYYLDTTDKSLGIGQLPGEYAGANATILPMVQQPAMYENFSFRVYREDASCAYLLVHGNVSNVGTGTARNATAYFAALAPEHGENRTWSTGAYARLDDVPEGSSGWVEVMLRVPRYRTVQVESILYGDNFNPVRVKSDLFYI